MRNAIISVFIILAMPVVVSAGTYSGGDGQTTPYQISTPADWLELIDSPNDYASNFVLVNDLDLDGVALTPVAQSNSFTGVFDGDDHIIRNVVIDQSEDYVGLFGNLGTAGEIYDLGVEDVNIIGYSFVGGLVVENYGSILNCYSTGSVEGRNDLGGLVGKNEGTITNCYSTCSIIDVACGSRYTGGLVGENYGSISNCYSTGEVSRGREGIGGLVGINWGDASVSNCYSTGDLNSGGGGLIGENYGSISDSYSTGDIKSGGGGGLVGFNRDGGSVSNCHSTGSVNGHYEVGGLVGVNDGGTISNCHSTGSVTGTEEYVGGLVGRNRAGSVSNCYSTGDVNGGGVVGGLVGSTGSVISDCYAMGNVNGNSRIGGLVGVSTGSVSNCYSAGDVNGVDRIGGLMGFNLGNVSNCYSAGDVNGNRDVGGLVGNNRRNVSNCFWDTDTQTHGVIDSFGLNSGTVVNVAGLPTAEMMQGATFVSAGWDFVTPVWTIDEGWDYPRLWWEYVSPLELLDILGQDVIDLELHHGIENSLLAKLDAALEKLEDDDESNDGEAVNILQAFINAVEAQYGKKISEADADVLIETAWQIIDLLGS